MMPIVPLIGMSIREPRETVRYLKALNAESLTAWMALAAAVALSVLFIFTVSQGAPVPLFAGVEPFGPWMLALFVFSTSVILVFGLFWTGRAMGGKGTLAQTILVMAWLQFLQLAGQVLQVVVILIAPGLGGLLGLLILGVLLYVLLHFIDALHELGGLGRAAFLLLMALVGVSLGLTLILGLIGVSAPGGAI